MANASRVFEIAEAIVADFPHRHAVNERSALALRAMASQCHSYVRLKFTRRLRIVFSARVL